MKRTGKVLAEQQALQDAAHALEEKRFGEAEGEEKDYEDKLREAGIEVIEFSDEELRAFAVKCREEVWPTIKDDFGAEVFDEITKDIK